MDPEFILLLSSQLRNTRVVHRFFSDELIANHGGVMDRLTRRDLEIIGVGMDSWDQVDCFAIVREDTLGTTKTQRHKGGRSNRGTDIEICFSISLSVPESSPIARLPLCLCVYVVFTAISNGNSEM